MSNKVSTIVFPLTKSCNSYNCKQLNTSSINTLYATTSLAKLKRVATLARKQGLVIQANPSISVHPDINTTYVEPKTWDYTEERVNLFVPELGSSIDYEWLLEQVRLVEEGAIYTACCLLREGSLIVFNSQSEYSNSVPRILIEELSTTVRTLLKSTGSTATNPPLAVWYYLTDFISTDKESPYKVTLSDEAKLLIADMRMKDMQDTTVYHVLQSISDSIDSLYLAKGVHYG